MNIPAKKSWQVWSDRRGRLSGLRIAALAFLLMPAGKALIEFEAISGGARPLTDLIHRSGFWALVYLGVTLAVTPLRRIARFAQLADVRRMIGVGTFCYIAAHLALYVADQRYDLIKVASEISSRVYLIIGAVAWLGLAVLAATSTDAMVRRLGGWRWRRLHQIVYAIALLALIHYFQQTKADVAVPTFVAGLFGWLIGYRLLAWRTKASELSSLQLLGLTLALTVLVFICEAFGIGLVFNVSPMRVLETTFDFAAVVRPGWQVLGAGLCVVALDFVCARRRGRAISRASPAE